MGRQSVSAGDISKAIKLVNLGDFISSVPMGLKTLLDPEGKKIPRSIKNKVLLARAIVNNPKLLLLEDALDHVGASEKIEILKRLTDQEQPWSIIASAVDPIWGDYIEEHVFIEKRK